MELIATNRPNSLNDYIGDYIKAKAAQGAKGSTQDTYTNTLQIVAKALGQIPVVNLTTEHFDTLLSQWREAGLDPKTITARISLVSHMFDWLVFKKVLPTNILTYYKDINKIITHAIKKPKKIHVLSSAEHEALKMAMKAKYDQYFLNRKRGANGSITTLSYLFYVVYLLAYETGMREGEIAALKWEDINLETNTVSVNANLMKRTHCLELSTPKSDAGFRDIVISQALTDILAEYKSFCKTDMYEFVFCKHIKGVGVPYSLNNYKDTFKAYRERIGMTRPFRFHDIRHTNASLMIAKGVPVPVITERLGHSSIEVTYRTYAHLLNEHKDKYKAVIEAL